MKENKQEAPQLTNPQEIEPYRVERTSTGIFCETKTIKVSRKIREAVDKMAKDEKGHEEMLAEMRKIERQNQEAGKVTEETLHILLL